MALNVMIVDDSATVRTQAGRALSQAGFEVLQAVDGIDALEQIAERTDILLVLCDVNMPRMDGIELVEALSRRPQPMPTVIMLTTVGRPELIKRARASGAKGWITKPFKVDALVAAARSLATTAA